MKYTQDYQPIERSDARPDSNNIEARSDIKLQPCVPCKQRGHYCQADEGAEVDGQPACNACADGEPCMHELIERRRKGVTATSTLPAEKYSGVKIDGRKKSGPRRDQRFCDAPGCTRKITDSNPTGLCSDHDRRKTAEVEADEMPEADLILAHHLDDAEEQAELEAFLSGQEEESAAETGNSPHEASGDQGAAELRRGSPVTNVPEVTDVTSQAQDPELPAMEPRADAPGFDQWLAERDRYREKRKQHKKEREMEQARVCGCGCGTPLKSRWPFIKGHGTQPPLHTRNVAKPTGARRGRPPKSAQPRATVPQANGHASPRRNGTATPPVKDSGVATLCVTEQHLDNYLLRLPLERKTALVQHDLEAQLNG